MKDTLERLESLTKDCREDMHEPDEEAVQKLIEAATELLRVDDDWHGAVNSAMSHARAITRAALKPFKVLEKKGVQ